MRHEKLIKKENGDKVIIKVHFWMYHENSRYDVDLQICLKGKRKFHFIQADGYEYRSLSMSDRRLYMHNKYLEHVTEDQIFEAKTELWNLLKPTKI